MRVVQAAEDLDLALERLQRLKVRLELKIGPLAARPPRGGDGTVGEIDESRPQGCARGGGRQALPAPATGAGSRLAERRERRQSDRSTQAAEKMAAADAGRMATVERIVLLSL